MFGFMNFGNDSGCECLSESEYDHSGDKSDLATITVNFV